jgi:hypothetical protein
MWAWRIVEELARCLQCGLGRKTQTFLQVDGKPFKVEVSFLLIHIDVVWPVLGKGVELPHVVKYNMVPMLKVQEFLQLGAEQAHK